MKSPSIVAADLLISTLLGAVVGWAANSLTPLFLAASPPWPGLVWVSASAFLLMSAWEVLRRFGITRARQRLLWSGGLVALLATAIVPLVALVIAGPVVGIYGLGLPVLVLTP